jgi:hypothetical protein
LRRYPFAPDNSGYKPLKENSTQMFTVALRRATTALLALFAVSMSVFAQSDNSTISGEVKDPTGAVVANAKVNVTNEETKADRQVVTNGSGFFTVTNISPGYYSVSVEAPGFKKFTSTRNKLEAALPYNIAVALSVGQVSDSINVEASAAQLNTETATVGKTIEAKQLESLTLNGRNPLFLALLKPGVRGGALSGFSFGLSSGGLTINGGRSQDSVITFDGAVGIRTRANGTSVGTADLDTVQEVQILTANYSAEYGRSSAGQVRVVTRSGGKDFHGSAYEYFRNSALDANSWARNRNVATNFTAPFRFNQFGYNVSGPAFLPKVFNSSHEKLFFLYSEEFTRFRREDTTFQRVPTALMRGGDFSELLGSNIFYGASRTINNPTTGVAYPGNRIPVSELSPNGLAFLKTYPVANGIFQGNANFFQVRPAPQNQRKDTIAIDFLPAQNHFLKFRTALYSFQSLDSFRSGFDYAITRFNRPNTTASLAHTWTLSPTMINEALVTASVDRVTIALDQEGQRFLRSRSGINYPYIFPTGKEIFDKVPTIEIPNLGTIDGGPYPSSSAGPIYNISDNFTKVHGNHTFKGGVLWERSGQNDFDQINVSGVPGGTNNQNGRFVFSDSRPGGAPGTGTGVANVALGLFSTYAELGTRAYTPYRSHMFEFFGQDAWRVNSKLKLELGFRGTWQNGYYKSLWGNIAAFDPKAYDPSKAAVVDRTTGNVISGDRFNGVFIPGGPTDAGKGRVPALDSGAFSRLYRSGSAYPAANQFNIMPRIGIAYQLGKKDVLRTGFGGFISRPGVYDSSFLGGNPPFQPSASVTNGLADAPGGAATVAFPQFFQSIDPAYKIPRSYNWNMTYQREIGFATTIEVAYIGTVGNYLSRERNLNQLKPNTTFNNPGVNVNALRPFLSFANINQVEHSGRSTYNGLQFEANRRFTKSLGYGFAYTFSKTMDNNSSPRDAFYDVFNQGLNWGKSGNDVRHIAVINFIYEAPFFNKAGNKLVRSALGGWQISGVTQFQTGTPLTIGNSDDYLGTGDAIFRPWNLNGDGSLQKTFSSVNAAGNYAGDTNSWFTSTTAGGAAYATKPANGTYANQNRNSVGYNQPGFQNWNLAAFKAFAVTEKQKVTFRFEAFNWLNHPNWSGADTNPTSATFGKITAKNSERNLQLSLRYSF